MDKHAFHAKKDVKSVKMVKNVKNVNPISSLKTTFVLIAAVLDLLIQMELVMLVLSTIVTYALLTILENVIDVFKVNSYTTINATKFAPLELMLLLMEDVNNVDLDVLYVEIKLLAQSVLLENYYKENVAKQNVMMDLFLLMEYVPHAKTSDVNNAIPNYLHVLNVLLDHIFIEEIV
jgi:hypothetical protein